MGDAIYSECASGISDLDRIIVGTPTSLSSRARTALVPALYAYWERYFRVTFGEFLRCVSLSRTEWKSIHPRLRKLRMKYELGHEDLRLPDKLITAVESKGFSEAHQMIKRSANLLTTIDLLHAQTASFPDADALIKIESNVGFKVVEKNCVRLGLDLVELSQQVLDGTGRPLARVLDDLVQRRNEIAHGNVLDPISSDEWNELKAGTLGVMNAIQMFLHKHLDSRAYLETTA